MLISFCQPDSLNGQDVLVRGLWGGALQYVVGVVHGGWSPVVGLGDEIEDFLDSHPPNQINDLPKID